MTEHDDALAAAKKRVDAAMGTAAKPAVTPTSTPLPTAHQAGHAAITPIPVPVKTPVYVEVPAKLAQERDTAHAAFVAANPQPAVVPELTGFKVGQTVTIRKGGERAVVTKSLQSPGKKQEKVECKHDNGTIHEYWFDEIA